MAFVPRLTMKVCVSSLPPLKNICSAANGRPMNMILRSIEMGKWNRFHTLIRRETSILNR
ncbi:hypothetical protein D3C73_1660180 [compost metagenome]